MRLAVAALIVSFGMAAVAGAETLTPYSNPAAYDSSGKFMGHLLGYDGSSLYLLFKLSSGEDITLAVRKSNGNLTWATGLLWYTSNDCSGPAYLGGAFANALDRYSAVGPGNVLYVSGHDTVLTSIGSIYAGGVCSQRVLPSSYGYILMNPTVSLDSVFQPPFKIDNASIQGVPAMNRWVIVSLALTLAALGLLVSRLALKA